MTAIAVTAGGNHRFILNILPLERAARQQEWNDHPENQSADEQREARSLATRKFDQSRARRAEDLLSIQSSLSAKSQP
jgi:hypothetical protein